MQNNNNEAVCLFMKTSITAACENVAQIIGDIITPENVSEIESVNITITAQPNNFPSININKIKRTLPN